MHPQYIRLTIDTSATGTYNVVHLFHSDTRAANSSLHGLAATFHLELNPAIAHRVRRYAHRVRSTRAATWICHDVRTHINADDRFVARGPDRVAASSRANHLYYKIVWREPLAISQVILTLYQPRDAVLYFWAQNQLCYALRRGILQSLDAAKHSREARHLALGGGARAHRGSSRSRGARRL